MKIVLIGPVPPPLGGISVHIDRLCSILHDEGIDYVVYNEAKVSDSARHIHSITSFKRFMCKVLFIRGDLFHFHTIDRRLRMMLGLYALVGKKIMLTVHGDSLASQIDHSRFISRWLLIRSLKSIDYIASVSESTTQKLLDMGLDENKVRTLPAYIRPRVSQKDMVKIPSEVIGFMEDAEIVISANGYVRFYRNEDLYGLDLLIELMKELVCISHHIRLVFAVMGVPEQSILERAYYDQLKDRIKGYGLENHFYFYEVIDAPFYPILMKSHLFVRPTCTDGYGVSIAEALQCSVPSIASDVCERPQGTIEFQSRNSKDLFAKVMHVLNHYEACKRDAGNVRMEDYGPKLIEIYRQITGKEGKNRGAVKWGYGK